MTWLELFRSEVIEIQPKKKWHQQKKKTAIAQTEPSSQFERSLVAKQLLNNKIKASGSFHLGLFIPLGVNFCLHISPPQLQSGPPSFKDIREQADEVCLLFWISSHRKEMFLKLPWSSPQSHCSELCVSSAALAADRESELSLLRLNQLRKQLHSIMARVN